MVGTGGSFGYLGDSSLRMSTTLQLAYPDRPEGSHAPTTSAGSSTPTKVLGHGTACYTCRMRKVRCDGIRPICTTCLNSHRECLYVPKKKLPGPPSAATLEVKLAGLQERYEELSALFGPNGHQEFSDAESSEDRTGPYSSSPEYPRTRTVSTASSECGEISDVDRDIILETFFQNQSRCSFYDTPARFYDSLEHSNPTYRPHRALLTAMILLGSEFLMVPGNETPGTKALLKRLPSPDLMVARVHSGISDSLAQVDRLQDSFAAANLLCHWLYYHGRYQEAQYLCSSTARLVISSRLHQIGGKFLEGISNEVLAGNLPLLWDHTLLGRPRDLREVGSRILVFWQSFLTDKILSAVTGLPSAYDDSEEARITTVWPRSLADYESGIAFQDFDHDSVDELLYVHSHGKAPTHRNRRQDTLFALLVQGMALVDRTGKLVTAIRSNAEPSQRSDLSASIPKLEAAVKAFSSRTPPATNGDQLERNTTTNDFQERSFIKLYLVTYVWSMIHISEMQLCRSLDIHSQLGPSHSRSHQALAVSIARNAVDVIRAACHQTSLTKQVFSHRDVPPNRLVKDPVNLFLGFILAAAVVPLVSEIEIFKGYVGVVDGSSQAITDRFHEVEQDFVAAHQIIESMARFYPILEFHLKKLGGLSHGSLEYVGAI